MNRRHTLSLLLSGAILLASGLSAIAHAADAGDHGSPFRPLSDANAERLMLLGYDPVAYFTQNATVLGNPAIQTDLQGVTWRFANADNRAAFLREPTKYMPQFGGYCANGINYAVPWSAGGGPNTWRIYRGKLSVFGGPSLRDHFEMAT